MPRLKHAKTGVTVNVSDEMAARLGSQYAPVSAGKPPAKPDAPAEPAEPEKPKRGRPRKTEE